MKYLFPLLLLVVFSACDSDPNDPDSSACAERCAEYDQRMEIYYQLLSRGAMGYVEYSKSTKDLCEEYADCGCCD